MIGTEYEFNYCYLFLVKCTKQTYKQIHYLTFASNSPML